MKPNRDVYDIINNRILSALSNGTVPWHRPWSGGIEMQPKNLISRKPYQGINPLLLGLNGYNSPWFLTYRQAQSLGAHVRAGEHGTPIVYWHFFTKPRIASDGSESTQSIPFLRYYTVFNTEQCDDIPSDRAPIPTPVTYDTCPIELCEQLTASYLSGPSLQFRGSRACYHPSTDTIYLPERSRFAVAEEYYCTLWHELAHSTGHHSRLDRLEPTHFASHAYSKEELVAEYAAALLCGHAGIENKTLDNSAAYIASWLAKLSENKKWLISAFGQAQKAANLLLGLSDADAESLNANTEHAA